MEEDQRPQAESQNEPMVTSGWRNVQPGFTAAWRYCIPAALAVEAAEG